MSHYWLRPNWEPGATLPQLPIQHFLDKGIKGLILDVDRTILPGKEILLPESVYDWIEKAKSLLKLNLCSNNPSKTRVSAVAGKLNLPFTFNAAKPRKGALIRVFNELKLKPSNISIVGDRIFTDVLVGNRLGLYTVLVRPIGLDGKPSKEDRVQRFEQKLANLLEAS